MKQLIASAFILLAFSSCNSDKKNIVDIGFADSLITHYTEPAAIKENAVEIEFWRNRIDRDNPGITNESKYASVLIGRFHLSGDIRDLQISDSILYKVDEVYNHKESGPILSLANHAILQHRFTDADSLLTVAKNTGIRQYESAATSFDVDFELGRIMLSETELNKIASSNDYGYYFRKSKLAHYKGELDTAIAAMNKAIELSGNNKYLKQAAISNTADLYLHNGKPQKAYELYLQSIALNAADLHSIMGLGWIALVHDKNDSLAESIFSFVRTKTKSPDPLFKLIETAGARADSNLQKKYALEFELLLSDSRYGNMYNKYLIELYTGILKDPAKAEAIAAKELGNRNTPQTNAWYAWAKFSNNKKEEAYKIFQEKVSGKPLEGLELYWMGKLMQGLDKGYNAQQFFKAAYKNRYDLSPEKVNDLDMVLEE